MKHDETRNDDLEFEASMPEAQRPIVYIRPITKDEIPNSEEIKSEGPFYAMHDADGRPLALFDDRAAAFVLARSQNMRPVSVH